MGTEVLLPEDILGSRRLGFGPSSPAASFGPRRRQAPGYVPNTNPRPRRRSEPRKKREGSPKPASAAAAPVGKGNLVMGQVTILRRGESLDSAAERGLLGQAEKEEKKRGERAAPVVLSSEAGGDLIVFGTGRRGPEPAAVPKQTRLVGVRTGKKAERAETYAGPAFSLSPSPRALPLPSFSSRKREEGAVHQSATRDLRRLLRLE